MRGKLPVRYVEERIALRSPREIRSIAAEVTRLSPMPDESLRRLRIMTWAS